MGSLELFKTGLLSLAACMMIRFFPQSEQMQVSFGLRKNLLSFSVILVDIDWWARRIALPPCGENAL